MDDLTDVAAALSALPPSCGPVRLIAVDGHAGSGKSTFAARLAEALGGAAVVRLDDLATHDELFAWLPRVREQVTGPLSRGADARFAPYDWTLRRFGAPRTLAPAPVIVIEGVGAGRRGLRPSLACLLWMDRGPEESWRRGRRRDGPAQSGFWDAWTVAETSHFAADPSRPYADALVQEVREGYVLRSGPRKTAGSAHPLTHRDQLPPAH